MHGIAEQTLYNYIKKHKEFLGRKELLKEQPKIKAKMNIVKNINKEDKDTSKWYLERKSKDEFSLKQELDTNIDGKIEISMSNEIKELAE